MTLLNQHNNPGFHKLPICLLENKDLKVTEVLLYSVMLSRYTMFTNEGKEYYDTYEQLAEHSGLSRSTVRTCLRRLEELRLVEIDKVVKSKNKLFNKNIWKVNSVFPASNVIYTKKVEHTVSKQSPKDFSSFDLDTINSELSVASVDQNLTYY